MASVRPRRGVVVSFDADRGLGIVRADDATELGFHCTRIADGTRTVDVGAQVVFIVVPGAPGRWEASGIVKL